MAFIAGEACRRRWGSGRVMGVAVAVGVPLGEEVPAGVGVAACARAPAGRLRDLVPAGAAAPRRENEVLRTAAIALMLGAGDAVLGRRRRGRGVGVHERADPVDLMPGHGELVALGIGEHTVAVGVASRSR